MKEDSTVPRRSRGGRLLTLLIGRPLRTSERASEEIGTMSGLPALSLDALTSVAYGPEAIMVVLGSAGVAQLHLVLPVTIAIVVLLGMLVFSYRQVIDGYPAGGGCYAVSRENLGTGVSLLAGASLVVDYTLTVAVSISAGVEALTAAYPSLTPLTVPLCIAILAIVTVLNLRGLGDAARAFFLPTAVFIIGILAVIAIGIIHPLDPHAKAQGHSLVLVHGTEVLGLLLILKAFSSGCSALTGVEAIANGVPMFREPRVTRAKRTELLLGILLGTMLLGLAVLASHFNIGPRSNNTVLNQIMVLAIGHGVAYYVIAFAVVIELGLAANTSFGGLPLLASLLAKDDFLPHFFSLRSDRLVLSRGILVLAVLSGVLLVGVNGNTNALIPMFAIGVFTGFTLAQTGMVFHWRRMRPAGWRARATLNGVGAAMTTLATVIFVVTKFTSGAWIVLIAVPALIVLFKKIRRYYYRVGSVLSLGKDPSRPEHKESLVIVPVTGISQLTEQALTDALTLGSTVIAINVVLPDDQERGSELQRRWGDWNPGVRLLLLQTNYHSIVHPVVRFVELMKSHHERIVVLIPVIVPRRWRHRILQNQLDLVLDSALGREPGVLVVRSIMRVDETSGDDVPKEPSADTSV
ncbi:MAG: APC family permease [Ferrimicrobium sp.]